MCKLCAPLHKVDLVDVRDYKSFASTNFIKKASCRFSAAGARGKKGL